MHGTYLRLGVTVCASDRTVIRAARRKLARSARRDPAKREARKASTARCWSITPARKRLVAELRL